MLNHLTLNAKIAKLLASLEAAPQTKARRATPFLKKGDGFLSLLEPKAKYRDGIVPWGVEKGQRNKKLAFRESCS